MAFKLSHILLFVLLWLSIVLFLFHEYHHFKAKIYKNSSIMQASDRSLLLLSSSSSYYHLHHHYLKKKKQQQQNRLMSRKVLANSRFDFSRFFKHHHLHHQHLQPPANPSDAETEIDPRYGVEKRRVPTGPNPLHH